MVGTRHDASSCTTLPDNAENGLDFCLPMNLKFLSTSFPRISFNFGKLLLGRLSKLADGNLRIFLAFLEM